MKQFSYKVNICSTYLVIGSTSPYSAMIMATYYALYEHNKRTIMTEQHIYSLFNYSLLISFLSSSSLLIFLQIESIIGNNILIIIVITFLAEEKIRNILKTLVFQDNTEKGLFHWQCPA